MTLSRRSSTRQQQATVSPSNTTLMVQESSSPGIPTAYTETNSVSAAQPLEDSTTAEDEDEDMVDKISDNESSDDNAITRCPCGKEKLPYHFNNGNDDNDEGLMVQCDQCEVWQHCKCVGLEEEKDIPDQYYCEQCRPENHKVIKTTHGRRCKRLYNSLGFPPDTDQDRQQITKPVKRRKKATKATDTPGSRKSSRQFPTRRTDTSSGQSQNEPNGTTGQSLSPIPSDSTDTESGWLSHGKNTITAVVASDTNSTTDADDTSTSKRSRRSVYSPVMDSHTVSSSESSSPTLTRRKKPASHTTHSATTNAPAASSHSHAPIPSSLSSSLSTHHSTTATPSTGSKRTSTTTASPSRNAQGRFHKNAMESRASTPHPSTTTPLSTPPMTARDELTSYWNEDGLPQREGSPPAKIKYPNSKMTMADMNKRAKQIMDHLDKIKSTLQQQLPKETDTLEVSGKTTATITKPVMVATSTEQSHQQDATTTGPPPSAIQMSQSDDEQQENDAEHRPRSLSTCSVSSSISSASTLPLLLDDDDASFQSSLLLSTSPTTPLPLDKLFDRNDGDGQQQQQQQESSVDMMDRVYQELLKFQRKFGGVLQVQQASSVR